MHVTHPGELCKKGMNNKYITWSIMIVGVLVFAILVAFYSLGFYKIFLVTSDSMYPTIKKQSLVIVLPNARLKNRDIISFKSGNNTIVTHRIVAIKKYVEPYMFFYTTKGDNNNFEDAKKVLSIEIIGKVILILPYVGVVLSPVIFGILFYIPFGVLVGRLAKKVVLSSKHGKKLVQ